jgi:phage tail protein X
MAKLITFKKAEEEIGRLQQYLNLVESYETDTVEKLIIKEYAYTNSITEVVKKLNDRGHTLQGKFIDHQAVLAIK